MNQPPGYGPPPGAPYPAGPPGPPRRRTSPWLWVAGGCAGCLVLCLVVAAVLGFAGFNAIRSAATAVGPVNQSTVQQALGSDVPLYPGANLDTRMTQGMLTFFRMMEKAAGKQLFRGLAFLHTNDGAKKVFDYYDQQLRSAGWQSTGTNSTARGEQREYRKGNEAVIVQVQSAQGGGSVIMLMRGGPEIKSMQQQQGQPSQVPGGDMPTPAPPR